MGLVVRLIVIVFLVLAIMLAIRAGVRRLWPVRELHPSARRSRALAWLDAAIAKMRRIALGKLGSDPRGRWRTAGGCAPVDQRGRSYLRAG
jgi:hypothetical protein